MARVQIEKQPVPYGNTVYLPIHIDSLRSDSVPKFDLYFRPDADQPFVLYCERNTPITLDVKHRLSENRIDRLFIKQEQRDEYNLYLADHLEDILKDRNLTVREKAAVLYDSAQAVVEDIMKKPSSRERIRRGKNVARHTVDFMTSEDFMLEYLLRTISCDYYLYTHSVNVVAYSIALALRSGVGDRATLREIANGALLHDIGKSALNPKIINKQSALTAHEWEEMRKHPRKGHEMLVKLDTVGEIALDIVLHHHEKLDGSGYPEHLKDNAISPFVRAVTIADIFDALTTDRFHQKGQTSFGALKVMKNEMRNKLDNDLLQCFVEMMAGSKKGK